MCVGPITPSFSEFFVPSVVVPQDGQQEPNHEGSEGTEKHSISMVFAGVAGADEKLRFASQKCLRYGSVDGKRASYKTKRGVSHDSDAPRK
jgi:hypothetical protein